MANYTIPTNPVYNATIRKLEDSDPASASNIFNPLIQQLIENTHAVKCAENAHTGDKDIHITPSEREKWNAGSLVSGSNDVGSYLKFPDGTMIEWGTAVDEAVPANGHKQKSIAFPVAFNGIPSVTATAEADTSKGAVTTQIGALAKTIVYIYAYNTAPVDRTVPIHWQAIGRWK